MMRSQEHLEPVHASVYSKESKTGAPAYINISIAKLICKIKIMYVVHDNYGKRGVVRRRKRKKLL